MAMYPTGSSSSMSPRTMPPPRRNMSTPVTSSINYNNLNQHSQMEAAATTLASLPNTPKDENDSEFESVHDGDHHNQSQPQKKRRRNRQTLSCTECKRRKIKCDRTIPCESCIKRDDAQNCHWEDPKKELPPQPFALASDLDSVKVRLAQLEERIRTWPPNGNNNTSKPGGYEDSSRLYSSSTVGSTTNSPVPEYKSNHNNSKNNKHHLQQHSQRQQQQQAYSSSSYNTSQSPSTGQREDELDSDTEDAALVLEELATKGPGFERDNLDGKHTRNRSLRFLDYPKNYQRIPQSGTSINYNPYPAEEPKGLRAVSILPPELHPDKIKYFARSVLRTMLPPKHVADALVRIHLDDADFSWGPIHRPTFMIEYEAFWEMANQGRINEVDPNWLSLLYMSCSLGMMQANMLQIEIDHPWSPADYKEIPQAYYEVAVIGLKISEWQKRPQFRAIQAMVLFNAYLQAAGHFYTPEWFAWLSTASRVAQMLGLHDLGSDENIMPKDDPAFPPGSNGVKREVAKKVWWQIVFCDYLQSFVFGHYNYVTPQNFTTNEPLNLDDKELSTTETNLTGKPEYVTTSATFLIFGLRMSSIQQKLFTLSRNKTLTYDILLEHDKSLREVSNRMMSTLDTYEARAGPHNTKQAFLKRCLITSAVNNRLALVHRSYMLRGYKDARYATSTSVCVSSAKNVLLAQKQMYTVGNTINWYANMHILSASLILFIDAFHAVDSNASDSELSEKEDILKIALDIFNYDPKSPKVSKRFAFHDMGLRVLLGLFDALHRRREAAGRNNQSGKHEGKSEPIGSVFKRLASCVSKEPAEMNSILPEITPLSNHTRSKNKLSPNDNQKQQSQQQPLPQQQQQQQQQHSIRESPQHMLSNLPPVSASSENSNFTPPANNQTANTQTNIGNPDHHGSSSLPPSRGESMTQDNSPASAHNLENFDFGVDEETSKLLKSLGLFNDNAAQAGKPNTQSSSNLPAPSGFEGLLGGGGVASNAIPGVDPTSFFGNGVNNNTNPQEAIVPVNLYGDNTYGIGVGRAYQSLFGDHNGQTY